MHANSIEQSGSLASEGHQPENGLTEIRENSLPADADAQGRRLAELITAHRERDVPLSVLAIDPGVTTGYSIAIIEDDRIDVYSKQEKLSQLDFYKLLNDQYPTVIICEDFQYRNRARAGLELYSVQLIGVVNLFVQSNIPSLFGPVLYMQSPAVIGGFFKPKQKLKDRGLYKTNSVHAMDSLRHLLYWFEFAAGYQLWNNKPYKRGDDA